MTYPPADRYPRTLSYDDGRGLGACTPQLDLS
jgi:hypothetical protein